VRAGELVPHEWNYRLHPEGQRAALQAIYQEVGFARSLLAFELPDGRLKLIDGHLRRGIDPGMEGGGEGLGGSGEEERALLLSIDPLAALAQTQTQLAERLVAITPAEHEELRQAWEAAARQSALALARQRKPIRQGVVEQYLVLVTCRDEAQQVELVARFQA